MNQSRLANRVLYDGLYTFTLRLLNIGCAAGLGILTARILGPAGKGIYSLPAIEAGLVAALFSGLNSATAYFLLNRGSGRATLKPAMLTAVLFVLAGAAALIPLAWFTGQRWTVVPAILFLPSAAVVNLAMGYATGIKRVPASSALQVLITILTLLLMLAAFFVVGRTPGLAIATWLIANTAVAAVALGAILVHSRRIAAGQSISAREYLFFAVKIGMVNLITLLNYRADLYIVAVMTSASTLGMYTVAVAAAESLLVPTQVAALVTSPYVGSLEVKSAGRLTARCIRNNLLIALVVCGLLFIFARPFIAILYGRSFLPMVPALGALLVGVVALALASPISSYFTLKMGKPEIALRLASLSAAVCIAVSITLVPRLGMLGAAIGSTAGYLTGQTLGIWYFGRVAHIGIIEMMLPTAEDLAAYPAFMVKVLRDVHRLLRPNPLGPTAHP